MDKNRDNVKCYNNIYYSYINAYLLYFVLPNQIWYIKLSLNPYIYSIFLGLTAGIFEEVGRYLEFNYLLKNNQRYNDGLSFGFGHWAIEALLIVGINIIVLLFDPSLIETSGLSTTNAFLMGLERLFVLSVHVGLSLSALSCVMLVGCSSNKLSDDFNEEELKSTTKDVIQMLCNEEYDKIKEMSGQELIDAGISDKIKEVWEPMAKKLGKFDSYDKEAVVGKGDQATVVAVTKFENGSVKFTISYNTDMKLTGFYIK